MFGYAERSLEIDYPAFLASHPDLKRRVEEVTRSAQQEAFGQDAAKVIAELQRRIAELEQSKVSTQSTLSNRESVATEPTPDSVSQSHRQLLTIIERLERRLTMLEDQMRRDSAGRRLATPAQKE
ncbi:hypothetical protein FBQ96_09085 [Nitrospirales bacterium NOB]|nr:MAG: hypothetical protein UZ03_NOB001000332 [Nitrospira sp. OLB3]MCE7966915.1 hypothetical protein [Nitrospira sp. NTP2]MDL1889717.1 hypothetical protein [Nitrospirales bacterium NOB]RIK57560.1 MAG: hypothetical protein DCC63_13840 [Nitrospira sp.]